MKLKKCRSWIFWILGITVCALGVALTSKASFGTGVIQGPSYAIFIKLSESIGWVTFGMCSYAMEGVFLILMCIIIKKFRLKFILSFLTAFLFGLALDMWRLVIGTGLAENIIVRIAEMAVGIVCVSFAVACYFRTDLPLEVWELFVKEIADRFGWNPSKFKWAFDISMLVLGIIICLMLFGKIRLDIIGIGTIAAAAVSGPIIGLFGKLIDRMFPAKDNTK